MTLCQRQRELLEWNGPLFALLDAAQSPAVLALLRLHTSPFVCLYSGQSASTMASVAPYLVELSHERALVEPLLQEGTGKHWGFFFSGSQSLDAWRVHFRKYLLAKVPDGRTMLFRFYDPRILASFLDGCSVAERGAFLSGIQSLWLERGSDWIRLESSAHEPIIR